MNIERVSSSAPKRLVSSPAPKRLVDITNSGLTGPPSIRKRTSAAATRAAEPGPPHRVDAEAIKELPKTAAQAAAPAEPPARTEAAAPTRWPRPVGAAVAWCRDAIVRSSELPPEPLADSLALGLVGGLFLVIAYASACCGYRRDQDRQLQVVLLEGWRSLFLPTVAVACGAVFACYITGELARHRHQ